MIPMTANSRPLKIGGTNFDFTRPYIIGILNVTPDSFSDGGRFLNPQKAINHALKMQDEGADIIDIGGESTRPGSEPVDLDEELSRVIPVIEALSSRIKVPMSIDTCKSEVARQALDAGATMINDISGLRGDARMAGLAAERSVPVIVMHIKGTPRTMQKNPVYEDLIGEIKSYFEEGLSIAEKAGIRKDRIILDPGIGFGKTFQDNFRIIKNLAELKKLGLPINVGASRKRFLSVDNRYPENERLEQSLAIACTAVLNGADFVRVHDVCYTKKALWAICKIRNA